MIHIFQSIAVVHKEIANPHCIQCLTEHLDIVDMPAQMHTYILYTVRTYIHTYIHTASFTTNIALSSTLAVTTTGRFPAGWA